MRGRPGGPLRTRQRGMVLLVLIGLISIMAIFAYVSGLNRSATSLAQARQEKTATALARAKEALIAHALTYNDTHPMRVPGYLPCPDLGTSKNKEGNLVDGVAAPGCGSSLVSSVGKLPWRTLGLDTLYDGSGECLWYAVSGTYKNTENQVTYKTADSNMMNWDTNGQFKVFAADGATLLAGSSEDNQAVAVIFAPGTAVSGQDRRVVAGTDNCGGNYVAAAYLETANGINNSTLTTPSSPGAVTDVSSFIAGTNSASFNDQLTFITRADIWNAIKKRKDFNSQLRALTRRAAECVVSYSTKNDGDSSDKRPPWASKVSLSTTSLPTYAVKGIYSSANGVMAGRLPFEVTNSSGCSLREDPEKPEERKKERIWYDHWKDQLFYAVANSFNPADSLGSQSCPTCVKLKSQDGPREGDYAALVIFAGEKLPGQSRNTATDKGKTANYLEGSSPESIDAITGGGAAYPFQVSLSGSFNDVVYAIDTTLAVNCFNGSKMVPVPAVAVALPGNLAAYAACP